MNKQLPSSLSRFAGIILLVFCYANLAAQTCTGNLLNNPGFENGLTGWNPQGNATIISTAHTGTKAVKLGGTGYASIGQAFATTAGTSYTASCWARGAGAVEMRFLNASWQQILGAGAAVAPTSSNYQQLTMTKIAPVGAVYVYILASKDGSQTMDLDDFCLASGGTANYPDLVPSNLTVPATVTQGTAFTYSFIAKNNGTAASAATSFSVEITGFEVARLPLQALQPGQQVTISKTMTLPQNFLYGGSVIAVKLDLADDLVQELQENNNEVLTSLQVNQGTGGLNLSDLTPLNLVAVPTNATQNTTASVSFSISNLGTAPVFANPLNPATQVHLNAVYLSTNNVLDANDILLNNSGVPIMTPIGVVNSLSIVFSVPNGTPAGSYFLIVKLDDGQQVPEQNENNNTAAVAFTVTANTGPCGIVATLEGIECYDNQTPTDPSDDQYCVTVNATYTGAGCSSFFTYNQENITYGSSITVCGFPANGTPPSLLLQDSANPSAQTTVTAQPPAGCSNASNLPDLEPYNILAPSNMQAGSTFPVSFNIRNNGNLLAAPTSAQIQFSGIQVAVLNVGSLQPGQSVALITQVTVPAQFTSGGQTISFVADNFSQVVESSEANNNYTIFVDVIPPSSGQVDLSLALQQLTATPTQWNNYSVKATISNAGPQAATGVKVKFAKPTGVVYVGGNSHTASQGTFNPNGDEVWTVGSIPANGSATLTVNYFLLNATAPVAYSQVTAANETDADSQPNNGTPPTPVQDDEASTVGGTTPQPCLINASITNFSCDNKGTPNDPQDDTYTYTYVVTNGNATGLWALFAGGASVAGGNYGEVMTRSGLYAAYGLNTNYLQVRDLTNPTCTTFINFPQPVPCNPTSPDITIADLQIPTASVAAGAILSYNFDASNAGTAAVPGNFTIKSYISTDQTLSANDIQDGNINTGNYAAGFSVQNVAGASTIPANLAAGSYYLIVKIDADGVVAEGNENNNVVVKAFTVTGGTPPSGDCNAITITPGANKITIAGFSAPHVLIKVFRPNWTVAYECLDGACATPTVITGLGTGNHLVEVKLLNATWGLICTKTQTVNVISFGGGNGVGIAKQEDERFRLNFDKIYPNPTAYLTNIELFSPKDQVATLDFYDQQGRVVHSMKMQLEEGSNMIELLVNDWRSGTYNVIARGEAGGLPAYGRFLKTWEE